MQLKVAVAAIISPNYLASLAWLG